MKKTKAQLIDHIECLENNIKALNWQLDRTNEHLLEVIGNIYENPELIESEDRGI
jgi:chaperonin cofactor prefoldin